MLNRALFMCVFSNRLAEKMFAHRLNRALFMCVFSNRLAEKMFAHLFFDLCVYLEGV